MTGPSLDFTREKAPTLINLPRAFTHMQDAGVDAIIATRPENVAYISNYYCATHWINKGTPVFAVLPADGGVEPCVITPALEVDAWADAPPWFNDLRPYGTSAYQIGREIDESIELLADDQFIFETAFQERTHPGALDVLVQALADKGLSEARLALDESGLSYDMRQQIVDRLPRAEFVDAAWMLRRIRMIKTPAEIQRLEAAAETTARALEATMAMAQPGVSERELWDYCNTRVAERGDVLTFAVISGGRRTGHPHPLATDYRLRPGDLVKYDIGCVHGFYHADFGRTQVIEAPNDEQQSTYNALLAAHQAAIAELRPGVLPSQVFEAALAAAHQNGLPNYRRHHVGHGIGIDVYDPPIIQAATSSSELSGIGSMNEPLEEGMTINIEAPYYVLGKHGMIVEDTLLITADGSRYLSHLPRELIV